MCAVYSLPSAVASTWGWKWCHIEKVDCVSDPQQRSLVPGRYCHLGLGWNFLVHEFRHSCSIFRVPCGGWSQLATQSHTRGQRHTETQLQLQHWLRKPPSARTARKRKMSARGMGGHPTQERGVRRQLSRNFAGCALRCGGQGHGQ